MTAALILLALFFAALWPARGMWKRVPMEEYE